MTEYDDVPIPGVSEADERRVRAFLTAVDSKFTYAKTLPEHPHEYLVRRHLNPRFMAEFDWTVALIAEHGYKSTFWRSTWRYIDVGEYAYWPSREWHTEGDGTNGMLNRRRLDAPGSQTRLEVN